MSLPSTDAKESIFIPSMPLAQLQARLNGVPPGAYRAHIVDHTIGSNGDETYVVITLEILGPTSEGRHVFDRLYLTHSNPKVMEIAHIKCAALSHAAGHPQGVPIERLYGVEIKIEVTHTTKTAGQRPEKVFTNVKYTFGSKAASPVAWVAPEPPPIDPIVVEPQPQPRPLSPKVASLMEALRARKPGSDTRPNEDTV